MEKLRTTLDRVLELLAGLSIFPKHPLFFFFS